MYKYIHIYIYTYTYVYIYTYIHVYIYMHTFKLIAHMCAATRDTLRSMFDPPSIRKTPRPGPKLSPRKKDKPSGGGVLSRDRDFERKNVMVLESEKMAALPTLFPPVVTSLRTLRDGHTSPWTPASGTHIGTSSAHWPRDSLRQHIGR